jgi:disulfide bond formation protein DsbB
VRCDAVPWAALGVSMAGWNAIISAGLAVVWGLAARKS